MRVDAGPIAILFAVLVLLGPLILGLMGWLRRGKVRGSGSAARSWDWRLTIGSALLYALAFEVLFLIQELFLVIPKALTPGLHPILYHNNHDWTGDNPLARLFQGTGALAILLVGLAALAVLRAAHVPKGMTARTALIWVAFAGLFQSVPQVVVGAILPQNDVGMAMDYLGLDAPLRWAAALLAMAAIIALAFALTRPLLSLAPDASRTGTIFRVGTVPAVLGTLIVIPFRLPGSIDQVALVPVAVAIIGMGFIQAGAWRSAPRPPEAPTGQLSPLLLLIAAMAMLAFFQVVLRPGIAF
ncbi:hypothetical protein [Sphingomonas alpina]|uniref:Uncharacterized protein n=1 Tax=Sphingomonas alpina TaxID=653931 RepID=A0A7H0LIG6_9SPHN|nr:hypothetical protein [Sphingomonas alpina]QNQ09469.1 hypothetical protein H3Z74_22985 [Sphingomonas alpina]